MATSAPRRCTTNHCPHPAIAGGKCQAHRSRQRAQQDHDRNQTRTASLTVYRSKRWKKLRKQVLHEEPYCQTEGCGRPARDVDHIIRIEDGGAPYDRTNLQALCHPHHSQKTAREARFGTRAPSASAGVQERPEVPGGVG